MDKIISWYEYFSFLIPSPVMDFIKIKLPATTSSVPDYLED